MPNPMLNRNPRIERESIISKMTILLLRKIKGARA